MASRALSIPASTILWFCVSIILCSIWQRLNSDLNVCKIFLDIFVGILGQCPFCVGVSSRLLFPLPVHFWTFSRRRKNQYKKYIKDHIADSSLWWKMHWHVDFWFYKALLSNSSWGPKGKCRVWTHLKACLPNVYWILLLWKIQKENKTHGFKKRLLVWLSCMNRKDYQILDLFHFKSLHIQERE